MPGMKPATGLPRGCLRCWFRETSLFPTERL